MLEIVDGIVGEVCQVVLGLFDVYLDVGNLLLCLLDVELRNLTYRLLAQFQHLLAGYLLAEELAVGVETALDACHLVVPCGKVFFLQHLVYALLEEYLFQRHPVPFVLQLGQLYLQLLTQQVFGAHGGMPQDVAGGHKHRLVVHDDAGLRREADLAVRKGIQSVDGLVGRHPVGQVAHDLHFGSRVVVDLLDGDAFLLVGLEDAFDEHPGGDAVRQLGDDYRLALVVVVHLGADAQAAAQCRIVVLRHIYQPACGEVGEYLKRFLFQYLDRSFEQFAEIIGQDVRRQRDGDTLCPLGQEQGELDRQGHRLLFSAVVAGLPLGGLRVEHHLFGKLGEACLDITSGGGAVARQYVAPVTLAVHQQVLLPQVHQRVVDGGVAVGVVEHGGTHDVGHLGVAAVVGLLHGMHDAPLHRLQAVVDVGHRTVQYDVGGIVNPIFAKHAAQRQRGAFPQLTLVGMQTAGFHYFVLFLRGLVIFVHIVSK